MAGDKSEMKKLLSTFLLSSCLLCGVAVANEPATPSVLPGGCVRPAPAEVSFSPLSSDPASESLSFQVDQGQTLKATTLTFAPAPDVSWGTVEQGGNYWVRVKRIDGDFHPAAGFVVAPKDGKLQVRGEDLGLLLQEFKDEPKPLTLTVEFSVTRHQSKDEPSEELGASGPVQLTLR